MRVEEEAAEAGTAVSVAAATGERALNAQELRELTVPLARKLGRLGSAAQFLNGLWRSQGQTPPDLVEPFQLIREGMRKLDLAIRKLQLTDASFMLRLLSDETERLRQLIVASEQAVSLDQVERHLPEAQALTSERLCRVLEFYAHEAPRGAEAARKALAIAVCLARREGLGGSDGCGIARALRSRIQLDEPGERPAPPELGQARQARLQLLDASGDDTPSEQAVAEASRASEGLLAAALYTIDGLGEAVALELAVEAWLDRLERAEARPFDSIVSSLKEVLREAEPQPDSGPGAPQGLAWEACGEARARELLGSTEQELREALAAGQTEERGLHLEEEEAAAIAGADGSERAELVLRGAVCRSTVDRLARRHARTDAQAPEPEPAPPELALELVRAALACERGFEDSVQEALMRGDMEGAKLLTRCLHRLSRARLGLALLARVPANGQESPEPELPAPVARARSAEEKIERELEAARIMRQALMGDKAGISTIRVEKAAPPRRERAPLARKPLLVTLAIMVVVSVVFHALIRPRLEEEPLDEEIEIKAPVPLAATAPIEGSFVATTDMNWAALSESEREDHARALWREVQAKGFANMMLVHADSGLPLAYASAWELKIFSETLAPGAGAGAR